VSAWADGERKLSPEGSAEPGQWSTARAAYQRGIMDALSEPGVHTVVAMLASQIGKTEMLLNVIGFYIAHQPAPMLLLQPTLEIAEAFSKDRLAPMLRDTPCLRGLVAEARSRDSGNTLLHKQFPGGHITLAGANSPASLASRPIRVVLCDEVDRYPVSAGTEGDPVSLARQRAATFWNRKIVLVSSPTVEGSSRIAAAFAASDQRRYHVPCPACGAFQVLAWAHVRWPADDPEAAQYTCADCAAAWSEGARLAAVTRGVWRASAPFTGTAGFHVSALASPWTRLGELAREFTEAKRQRETLQTFINLKLAELWQADEGEVLAWEALRQRAEDYAPRTLPDPTIALVTAGVDVQADRLAVVLLGWGPGEECWVLGWDELFGDPRGDVVWRELDGVLAWQDTTPAGRTLGVMSAAIDSGYATAAVYHYVRQHAPRVIAVKGIAGAGRPVLHRPTLQDVAWSGRTIPRGVQLWPVGVDTAKAELYHRLTLAVPGPRAIHFPAALDADFYEQLTAERCVTRYVKGIARREWHLVLIRLPQHDTSARIPAAAAVEPPTTSGIVLRQPDKHVASYRRQAQRSARLLCVRLCGGAARGPRPYAADGASGTRTTASSATRRAENNRTSTALFRRSAGAFPHGGGVVMHVQHAELARVIRRGQDGRRGLSAPPVLHPNEHDGGLARGDGDALGGQTPRKSLASCKGFNPDTRGPRAQLQSVAALAAHGEHRYGRGHLVTQADVVRAILHAELLRRQ
jgi:phage terminase large subunit GpA-like protein